jgi:hypothetical protein
MKNLILAIALFSFAGVSTAQEPKVKKETSSSKNKKSAITFTVTEINRPAIPYDSQELFIFEFKNTGKVPLLIQNVQTSCGCTTAEKPSEPIQPGKKSKISVKYDTKRVGGVHKTITVTTNVSEPIVLTIKGEVLPAAAPAAEPLKN